MASIRFPHSSIIDNDTSVTLEPCRSENCGCRSVHCPLCVPGRISVRTKSDMRQHVTQIHEREAVVHHDKKLLVCLLGCADYKHYHCPLCGEKVCKVTKKKTKKKTDITHHLSHCTGPIEKDECDILIYVNDEDGTSTVSPHVPTRPDAEHLDNGDPEGPDDPCPVLYPHESILGRNQDVISEKTEANNTSYTCLLCRTEVKVNVATHRHSHLATAIHWADCDILGCNRESCSTESRNRRSRYQLLHFHCPWCMDILTDRRSAMAHYTHNHPIPTATHTEQSSVHSRLKSSNETPHCDDVENEENNQTDEVFDTVTVQINLTTIDSLPHSSSQLQRTLHLETGVICSLGTAALSLTGSWEQVTQARQLLKTLRSIHPDDKQSDVNCKVSIGETAKNSLVTGTAPGVEKPNSMQTKAPHKACSQATTPSAKVDAPSPTRCSKRKSGVKPNGTLVVSSPKKRPLQQRMKTETHATNICAASQDNLLSDNSSKATRNRKTVKLEKTDTSQRGNVSSGDANSEHTVSNKTAKNIRKRTGTVLEFSPEGPPKVRKFEQELASISRQNEENELEHLLNSVSEVENNDISSALPEIISGNMELVIADEEADKIPTNFETVHVINASDNLVYPSVQNILDSTESLEDLSNFGRDDDDQKIETMKTALPLIDLQIPFSDNSPVLKALSPSETMKDEDNCENLPVDDLLFPEKSPLQPKIKSRGRVKVDETPEQCPSCNESFNLKELCFHVCRTESNSCKEMLSHMEIDSNFSENMKRLIQGVGEVTGIKCPRCGAKRKYLAETLHHYAAGYCENALKDEDNGEKLPVDDLDQQMEEKLPPCRKFRKGGRRKVEKAPEQCPSCEESFSLKELCFHVCRTESNSCKEMLLHIDIDSDEWQFSENMKRLIQGVGEVTGTGTIKLCPRCGAKNKNLAETLHHYAAGYCDNALKDEDNGEKLPVDDLDQQKEDEKSPVRHRIRRRGRVKVEESPEQCLSCNKSFSLKELCYHVCRTHNCRNMLLSIEIDSDECNFSENMKRLIQGVGEVKGTKCPRCGAKRNCLAETLHHYAAGYCENGSAFYDEFFTEHGVVQDPLTKMFKCNKCPIQAQRPCVMRRHIESKHMPRMFKCEVCPRQFATEKKLEYHQRCHKDHVECSQCGKRIIEEHLAIHIQQVHCDKSYKCDLCYFVTKHANGLQRHMANMHEKTNNLCDNCGKHFGTKTQLQVHYNAVHLGIRHKRKPEKKKTVECPECGVTLYKKNLQLHISRKHRKIKPFRCDFCGKYFASKESVKLHKMTHLPKKKKVPTATLR